MSVPLNIVHKQPVGWGPFGGRDGDVTEVVGMEDMVVPDDFCLEDPLDLRSFICTGFIPTRRNEYLYYKICDFAYAAQRRNTAFDSAQSPVDDDFVEVDTSRLMVNRRTTATRRGERATNKAVDIHLKRKAAEEANKVQKRIASAPKSRLEKSRAKQKKQERANNHWVARPKVFYEWSIEPKNTWTNVGEFALQELVKYTIDPSELKFEDVKWCGQLVRFNRTLERISPKQPRPLMPAGLPQKYDLFDDEGFFDAAEDPDVDVIASDDVLAVLMSATHSRYSWYLKITKADGKIIIERDSVENILDFVTVRECAKEHMPVMDDNLVINRPRELHEEATKLQNAFNRLALSQEVVKRFEEPKIDGYKGRRAFRYRKITIPPLGNMKNIPSKNQNDITIFTRAEISAVRRVGNIDHNILVRCMNEYDNVTGSYKNQIERHMGALSAAEYRNNSSKVARWVSQSMISGCTQLALGWITRKMINDNKAHTVLTTNVEKLDLLEQQLGVKPAQSWGMLRSILNVMMHPDKQDGQYYLAKEPLKANLRLLYVGADFEE